MFQRNIVDAVRAQLESRPFLLGKLKPYEGFWCFEHSGCTQVHFSLGEVEFARPLVTDDISTNKLLSQRQKKEALVSIFVSVLATSHQPLCEFPKFETYVKAVDHGKRYLIRMEENGAL
jgi:hypothetical protein